MMYYIGFFANDLNKMMIFSDEHTPSKKKYGYFGKVIGPYGSDTEARMVMKTLRRGYGYSYNDNPSKAKYCRERQLSPGLFDPKSFRTITLGKGKKGVIGCPKKHFHSGKCAVGTRLQTILHHEGTGRCPRGAGGRELAKRHDNAPPVEWKEIFDRLLKEGHPANKAMQLAWKEFRKTYDWYHGRVVVKNNPAKVISHKQALALTKKIIRYAKQLFKHERHGIRYENPGAEYHAKKFVYYMKELEKYKLGSPPYIATLAKAYEHLESERVSREESYR